MNAAKLLTVLLAAVVSIGARTNTSSASASNYIEFEHRGTQDGAWPGLIISTRPMPQTIPLIYNDVVDDATYHRIGRAIRKSGCTRARGRGTGITGTFLVSEHAADGSEISWCMADPHTSEWLAIRICRIYRRAGIKSEIRSDYRNLLAIRAELQEC